MSNVGNNGRNWRNSEVVRRPNNGRNDYRGNYENSRQGNQWFESRNSFQNDDRRFNDRGYYFMDIILEYIHLLGNKLFGIIFGSVRNRGQNDDFSKGDQRNRVRVKSLVEAIEDKWDD
ncbi:uncharacterized protein TNCV_1114741 [Trichonephila clavipes]|nr:uncharacterized protein TNCV_1114741 [Trichonephila clavipes]